MFTLLAKSPRALYEASCIQWLSHSFPLPSPLRFLAVLCEAHYFSYLSCKALSESAMFSSPPWWSCDHCNNHPLTFPVLIDPFMSDEQSTNIPFDEIYLPVYSNDEMMTTTYVPVEEDIGEIEHFQMLSNAYTPQVEVGMFVWLLAGVLMSTIGSTGWATTTSKSPSRLLCRRRPSIYP